MANPNKTVAAFRQRKQALLGERIFIEALNADLFANEWRGRKGYIVRVTKFRVGRRLPPWQQHYNYAVRVYTRDLGSATALERELAAMWQGAKVVK